MKNSPMQTSSPIIRDSERGYSLSTILHRDIEYSTVEKCDKLCVNCDLKYQK